MMRAGGRLVFALTVLGGLSVLGSTRIAAAGEPLDDRLGIRTVPLFLLFRSDIQKDLRFDPAQINELNRFAAELYGKALSLKGKVGPGVIAARRAIDEEESNWMSSHLRPDQRERLGQIDLQWEGPSALLSRPVVAEYLGMTSEQQEQVARIYRDAKKERVTQGPWTYEEHIEITRKSIALLSEKQRHLWAKVLGRPCRFMIATGPPAQARPSVGEKANGPAGRG
jgi:hypothetical protein